jgi:Flp pilus assembly protein TadB
MPRRFALTISTKLQRPPEGAPTRSGPGSRIRSFVLGFIVLVVVAAALFVGSIVGAAVALVIGVLLLVALTILIVRGTLDRGRKKTL